MLGVRVADDLRWGLPPEHPVDVEALLAAVGLDGLASRETATLSGGELQRLAIAAALARAPALLSPLLRPGAPVRSPRKDGSMR